MSPPGGSWSVSGSSPPGGRPTARCASSGRSGWFSPPPNQVRSTLATSTKGAALSTGEILGLGAIAGFTIFLGLPVGRMRGLSPAVRTLLNAIAIGVLVFLIVDVLTHATEPVEARLTALTGDNPHG